jgi:hypothetical protein
VPVLKINVWYSLPCEKITGPFLFAEVTIPGNIYLDMLEEYKV